MQSSNGPLKEILLAIEPFSACSLNDACQLLQVALQFRWILELQKLGGEWLDLLKHLCPSIQVKRNCCTCACGCAADAATCCSCFPILLTEGLCHPVVLLLKLVCRPVELIPASPAETSGEFADGLLSSAGTEGDANSQAKYPWGCVFEINLFP